MICTLLLALIGAVFNQQYEGLFIATFAFDIVLLCGFMNVASAAANRLKYGVEKQE